MKTKNIAERFTEEFEAANFSMILNWLKQQPENNIGEGK